MKIISPHKIYLTFIPDSFFYLITCNLRNIGMINPLKLQIRRPIIQNISNILGNKNATLKAINIGNKLVKMYVNFSLLNYMNFWRYCFNPGLYIESPILFIRKNKKIKTITIHSVNSGFPLYFFLKITNSSRFSFPKQKYIKKPKNKYISNSMKTLKKATFFSLTKLGASNSFLNNRTKGWT